VSITNAAPIPFEIDILGFDPQTDLATVTFKSATGVNYVLDASTNPARPAPPPRPRRMHDRSGTGREFHAGKTWKPDDPA